MVFVVFPAVQFTTQQLLTHNMPTDYLETTNVTDEGRDILRSCGLFPEEQKGCHKQTRETGYLLYMGLQICNESKTKRKDLAIMWIDNENA